MQSWKAFTLIEMMLVLALSGLIALMGSEILAYTQIQWQKQKESEILANNQLFWDMQFQRDLYKASCLWQNDQQLFIKTDDPSQLIEYDFSSEVVKRNQKSIWNQPIRIYLVDREKLLLIHKENQAKWTYPLWTLPNPDCQSLAQYETY